MTLKDLTPAARAAVEQKTIGGGWDGRSLVKLMAELDRWDNIAEGRKAWAKRVFIGGIIGSVVGFFLMFAVSAITEEFLWGLLVFLVPLAVLIMGIRMKKDMTFDAAPATRDFGWKPRGFNPVFAEGGPTNP